jgi:hypothetical protein
LYLEDFAQKVSLVVPTSIQTRHTKLGPRS